MRSPYPKEKCYILFDPFQNLHLLLFKHFSFALLQPFRTVAGFLTVTVWFVFNPSYTIFSASENIVLLTCLFSKQKIYICYTFIFPRKAFCYVEVIHGLIYNKKFQFRNIFSILLSVHNKRIPLFLEHLRVSPIRGHVVLKLPVFQTPIII